MSSFDRKICQLITFIEQKDYEKIISFINNYTEDINESCYEGKTILQLLIENRIDYEEIFNVLYIKKVVFEEILFSNDKNELFYNNIGLIKSIINHGFYINKKTNRKFIVGYIKKPLFFFIKKGKNDIVRKLLENGANIEDIDEKTSFTPLFYAFKCGQYDIFRFLLNEYQAFNNLTTEKKQDLLMYMRVRALKSRSRNCLLITKKSQIFQCFADLDKIINNCEITELNNGNIENKKKKKKDMTYQLITAIDQKDCEKIINILSQSDNVDSKVIFNDLDLTMDMAMKNGINNKELYDFIIKKGGTINSFFFVKKKKRILDQKYIENNIGLIKSIIENGFYIFVSDEDDRTNLERRYINNPLNFFKEKKLDEIVKVLLDNKGSLFEIDDDIQVDITKSNRDKNISITSSNSYNKIGNNPFINESNILFGNSNVNNESIETKTIQVSFTDKFNKSKKIDKIIEDKLLECIDQKNYKEIINIFKQSDIDDINQLYSDKRTVMDILLDKKIDNKGIFDFITKNKGFINNKYLNVEHCKLIEYNIGLIKSIIKNGFCIKKFNNEIIHINTPLIFFIEKKLNGIVKVLLKNKAFIEETDENGNTPIFQTIKSKNYEIFKLLLYQADLTKINKKNQTLLMYAINCSKIKIDPFVIELRRKEWKSALELKSKFLTSDNINSINAIMKNEDPLGLAIQKNDYEKIIVIINQFTNSNINSFYANGKTIMSILIEFIVDFKSIYDLLFEKGAYIDKYLLKYENAKLIIKNNGLIESMIQNGFYTNNFGNRISFIDTPIRFFTKVGKINLINNFLNNGYSPNEVDSYGLTPIFYAIKYEKVEIVKLLYAKGADITKKNHLNQTPLEYAELLSKSERYNNGSRNKILSFLEEQIPINFERFNCIKRQLMDAINQKNSNEIINILEQSNIDINFNINKRYTAMDMIIDNKINDKKVFDFLFKYQSSINDLMRRRELIKNNLGLIKSIIENGCYVNNEDDKIKYINNPLIFFIKKKLNGITKVLLENKISLEEVDEDGNTPLFQAIKTNNYEIFDLLIHQYQIDITKRNKNDETPLMYAIKHGEAKFNPFVIELKRLEKIGEEDTTIGTGTEDIMIERLKIAIYQNNEKEIMSIINHFATDNINKPCIIGEGIMTILIKNFVNSKAIYDLLFDKKACIDEDLLKNNQLYLINRNNGLIESIASNGFYITNDRNIVTCITEPVIFFTEIGNKDIVKKLLDTKNCSPNEMDSFGFTPIFYAIRYQNIEVFDLLLEYEADLSIKTNILNLTPLTYTIEFLKFKIFKEVKIQPYDWTLRYMKDYLKIDNFDKFPSKDAIKLLKINYILFKLENKGKGKKQENEERCSGNHQQNDNNSNKLEIKDSDNGDDSSSNDNGLEKIDDHNDTLLIKLVKNSNSDIRLIENLLSLGANVNYCDNENKTPLFYAIENENTELIKLLIKYKADINYEVCGMTPLKLAVKKNNINIGRIILDHQQKKNELN